MMEEMMEEMMGDESYLVATASRNCVLSAHWVR
jgi:hypothetical protein